MLRRALTHRSYLNENPDYLQDNERLEFLGDSVIDLVTASWLFQRYPEMHEGDLTRLRAALVRTEQLAALAQRFEIGQHLRLGKGAAESGGRHRKTLLCAAFEAIVGALYLDAGLNSCRRFMEPLLPELAEKVLADQTHVDSKSRLQEWAQAEFGITPQYHTHHEEGPDHAKQFTVQVLIGEKIYGTGQGHSKQIAAQAAASNALQHTP